VPSAPAHNFVCGPSLDASGHLDLHATLRLLQTGSSDPTASAGTGGVVGAWRALRTPEGPATLQIRRSGDRFESRAWGPGAIRALDSVPDLVGLADEDADFRPGPGVVRELQRRHRGLRLGRTGAVLDALVPTVLEQKVTSIEAHRSWRRLVRRYGEPAPGPTTLLLPPDPQRLAGVGYADLHPLGIERRRAEIIIAACRRAGSVLRRDGVGGDVHLGFVGRRRDVSGLARQGHPQRLPARLARAVEPGRDRLVAAGAVEVEHGAEHATPLPVEDGPEPCGQHR
jgi:hypothetical protein